MEKKNPEKPDEETESHQAGTLTHHDLDGSWISILVFDRKLTDVSVILLQLKNVSTIMFWLLSRPLTGAVALTVSRSLFKGLGLVSDLLEILFGLVSIWMNIMFLIQTF